MSKVEIEYERQKGWLRKLEAENVGLRQIEGETARLRRLYPEHESLQLLENFISWISQSSGLQVSRRQDKAGRIKRNSAFATNASFEANYGASRFKMIPRLYTKPSSTPSTTDHMVGCFDGNRIALAEPVSNEHICCNQSELPSPLGPSSKKRRLRSLSSA